MPTCVWSRRLAALTLANLIAPATMAAEPRPREAPKGALPRLERTSAREAQAAWTAVKDLAGAASQLEAVGKKRLAQKACDDLVDLRAVADAGALAGFSFRDNVRGRSWARPTLALLLSEAMKRFQAEYPGRVVAIGDVSQPGCGQLEHGVLVKDVQGKAAEALLDAARLTLSEWAVVEVLRARDFPWEADRFGPPDERVLVTTRLIAKDGDGEDLRLRTARTRHRELAAPTGDEVLALEREVVHLVKGTRVSTRKVTSVDQAGASSDLWMSHWVAPPRQLVLITRTKPGRRLDWADVVEVRVSNWQDKKPGSFPDEVRWVVERVAAATPPPGPAKARKPAPPTPASAVTFSRWALMYEAGHITHLSGIDADLSYVTIGDTRHFAVDLEAMDVAATWRWLEILEATGRTLGTPVDAFLVDAKVKRHLERTLPTLGPDALRKAKRSKAWRLLTLVGGHDAHHHLRIVEGRPEQERAARRRLLGQ